MADAIVKGLDMALALCEICSIDPRNVRKITVSAGIDGIAEVIVEGIVRTESGKPMIEGNRVKEFKAKYAVLPVGADG